ncbi:MAG: serine--tRNA ligase [Chloroflexi bacterium RBG_13_51_18]|nr:MAG: serine--tRNA ligase [Chloroflexi bacterium RBG_13_51_18]
MLDIKLIRENPDLVKNAIENRHDSAPIDEVLRLDAERRRNIVKLDALRQERKVISKEREKAQERGRALRTEIQTLEEEVNKIDRQLEELLLQIPNIPQPDVPIGKDDSENVTVRTWGEPKKLDFSPLPHWTLGENLKIIDFERGVKLSGSRFYILKGMGARLQRALITFFLDLHTREHGYSEIYPPYMVKRECMVGAGQLPKFAENIYHDAEEDYWFVGTAEIPLTNLHRDEILTAEELPLYYCAYTACFRREKMSAGKDTRGIKRGHQFDKVELYKFVMPETSNDELEKLTRDAEDVCQKLGLAYRIRKLCTGDLGFTSIKSYDIDVWAPGCGEWLEVSSCSNCGDFQARRANVRYRPEPNAKPQFVHTLNGSGLALPRIMIAVMENNQQADGSINVPEVLQSYVGAKVIK